MSNMKKITLTLLIVGLLAGIAVAVFFVVRPLLTQPDNFVIVPAFEGQAEYVAAVRADPAANKDALYKKYVTERYRELCGGYGALGTTSTGVVVVEHPLGDLDQFDENVQALRRSDIGQLVKTALQKSAAVLPGSKITVCLFAIEPDQQGFYSLYMHGMNGGAASPTLILIEATHRGDWQDWVAYTVAHEYNHAVQMQHVCQPDCRSSTVKADLLYFTISEGLADSFARTLYPDRVAPWTTALTPEQEAAQWRGMQEYLTSLLPADRQRFLFGDGNQIPQWTGYTIGFRIVQKYIQSHPQSRPVEWIKLGADQLLAESGYSGQ